MVNSIGEHSFKLEVYPFTIKGLDFCEDFKFTVFEKSEKRENIIKEIEERDKKIKLEKSFFQEMISTLTPTQEEEESDDEEEDKKKKSKTKESNNDEEESSNDEIKDQNEINGKVKTE